MDTIHQIVVRFMALIFSVIFDLIWSAGSAPESV